MSWEIINEILALATVDHDFCQELLEHPLEAIQSRGFPLTFKEQEAMCHTIASSLHEFSQLMLETLAPANVRPHGADTNHI